MEGFDWKVRMYLLWVSAALSKSSSSFMLLIARRGVKESVVRALGEMAKMSMWEIAGEEREASLVKHVVLGGLWLLGWNLSGGSGGAGQSSCESKSRNGEYDLSDY